MATTSCPISDDLRLRSPVIQKLTEIQITVYLNTSNVASVTSLHIPNKLYSDEVGLRSPITYIKMLLGLNVATAVVALVHKPSGERAVPWPDVRIACLITDALWIMVHY